MLAAIQIASYPDQDLSPSQRLLAEDDLYEGPQPDVPVSPENRDQYIMRSDTGQVGAATNLYRPASAPLSRKIVLWGLMISWAPDACVRAHQRAVPRYCDVSSRMPCSR